MSAADTPIPSALVVPIIQAYTHGIRPAFAFILIPAIFSAMLLPLLVMLFAFSTPQSRRMPIFILNVLAMCLGLCTGALCLALVMQVILSPFSTVSSVENCVYDILSIWTPWMTEAVLLLRVMAILKPLSIRRVRVASLLAFPVTVKAARAAINVLFLIRYGHGPVLGSSNAMDIIQHINKWMFKAAWILEVVDNGYISALFLLHLSIQAHVFNGSRFGRVDGGDSRDAGTRLKSLCWIASTNFVFSVVFGLCQIILLFTQANVFVLINFEMVNLYVSIICTVFATIWSASFSFERANLPLFQKHPMPGRFRGDQELSEASSGSIVFRPGQDSPHVDLENTKVTEASHGPVLSRNISNIAFVDVGPQAGN
ncbi:hypothetical protein LshimejAT787_0604910 [Lyophyllum shimeji]|uniref:Uncharacterized protein n=1 Tax=Lyophyllum shimeji TaxID=47721 RepID=A0A9P3PPT4_LYOSH|nr:hypothetical protein LshimejAT787_0604910 [Lyophyllum shimeji]